mgnify:CR=1 FL=1
MSDGRPFSLSGKPVRAPLLCFPSSLMPLFFSLLAFFSRRARAIEASPASSSRRRGAAHRPQSAPSTSHHVRFSICYLPCSYLLVLDDDDGDMDDFQATPEKSPAARRLIPFSSPTQAGRIMQTALLNSGARPPRIPLGVTPGASPPKPHKKATLVRSASASTITAPAKRSRSDGKRSDDKKSDGKRSDDKKSDGSSRGSGRGSKHSSSSQGSLGAISSIDDYEYPTAPTYTPSAPVETVDRTHRAAIFLLLLLLSLCSVYMPFSLLCTHFLFFFS